MKSNANTEDDESVKSKTEKVGKGVLKQSQKLYVPVKSLKRMYFRLSYVMKMPTQRIVKFAPFVKSFVVTQKFRSIPFGAGIEYIRGKNATKNFAYTFFALINITSILL